MRWPRQDTPVLAEIDLRLPGGCLAAIGGANGAGKTTLLRIITGLLEPAYGSVRVRGLDPIRDRRRYQNEIGFLPAGNSGLYARLTTVQHLDYWSRIAFVPRAQRRARIAVIVEEFGLSELAGRRVDRMSMGQRQRVRLGMAFLPEPKVVLLDEPRNSLDGSGMELLASALRRLAAGGGTAICCSPSGEDVGVPADRSYVLEGGKLHVQ